MATLIVNIPNEKDLPVLKEILNRFGFRYTVKANQDYAFSAAEIEGFLQTKQDFLAGKTTARSWNDIEEDLVATYDINE